ncbi:hypothetical protein FVR03_13925 [Pontibacter qinzhouensis]|uniref:Lipocalin-like domain-containing protein n=1 Tax=Pontibacter qinzhouensis TaxID=2603253 RepID=A0A5C8K640_9BACT|nr:hypothetical protein [Pontibacter qinzhouensis]TXK44274.1 hypothetical protein FVR03_13925 [Pontibacter qinzhouensis]
MKKSRLLSLLSLLFAVALLTGCKDDEPNPEKTKTEMLTEANWQGDKILVMGMDVATTQFAGSFPDIKTMVLNFKTDGTYTATYTDNGQAMTLEGNWEFRNNENVLHFDLLSSFGLPEQVDIKTLTSTNLALTTVANIPGAPLPVSLEVQFVRN